MPCMVIITMLLLLDDLLSLIAPHKCKRCGVVGSTLCQRCINDTLKEINPFCVYCGAMTNNTNLCGKCRKKSPFDDIYAVGYRQGALKHLVGDYKYHSEAASCRPIAQLFCDRLAPTDLPDDIAIVYIPTIPAHIRRRGFDHMGLVARQIRRILPCHVASLFIRVDNTSQHELSERQRHERIQSSLALNAKYIARHGVPQSVLIIDDIWTTGATLEWAAILLRRAGVEKIYAGVICRQPKD